GDNRGIQALRHAVEREAVMRGGDEFLFQPEFFLEIFQLREKVDQVKRDGAQGLNLAQVLLDGSESFSVLHVIQMHDFVLDVKIQLVAQKTAEIFVNEIIGGVARGVLRQVFFKQGALRVFLGRRALA